jgi:hypothetical protein
MESLFFNFMYSPAPFKKKVMSSVQSGYNGVKQASIFAWNAWIGTTLYFKTIENKL